MAQVRRAAAAAAAAAVRLAGWQSVNNHDSIVIPI